MNFDSFERCWFLTWTTYGTWLPGDERGFVSPKYDQYATEFRNNVLGIPYDEGRPQLRELAAANLIGPPIYLTLTQAGMVREAFDETALHRGWTVVTGAVMDNHVHLLVGVPGDPDPAVLMRDFKSYASRPLNRVCSKPPSGTWWTGNGSKRKIKDAEHFENVRKYILAQPNPLVVWEHESLTRDTGERGA